MRRLVPVLVVCGFVLPAFGCGGDFRNGRQDEAYLDPGPDQIAQSLAAEYVTPDSAAVSGTFRGMAVWRDRSDGHWVYVERTSAGEAPERTVYNVDYADGPGYRAEAYAVPDDAPPLPADLDRNGPDPLADLAVEDLTHRASCALLFERTDPGAYVGTTEGTACPSNAPGAAYSVTTVNMDGPFSVWTRAVDAEGVPVAGPSAPTVYARVSAPR